MTRKIKITIQSSDLGTPAKQEAFVRDFNEYMKKELRKLGLDENGVKMDLVRK